ncbi:MAG: hypothetical protein WC480_01155 [Patescibacteria group bacterium]
MDRQVDFYRADSFPFAFCDGKRERGVFLAADTDYRIGDLVRIAGDDFSITGVVIGLGGFSQSGVLINGVWLKVNHFALRQAELEAAFGPTLAASHARIKYGLLLVRYLVGLWLIRRCR